jgi:transposase-like protein
VETLVSEDRDLMKALLRETLQEVLDGEMTEVLGAAAGERTDSRTGYRAGYYSRNWVTRIGKLELRVPRDRNGEFSTALFERYQRSEKALVGALAEMYVQGVSTRKGKAITEELCGHSFSASTISQINKGLDEALARFANRHLDEDYPYLILDAATRRCARTPSSRARRCWWRSASTGRDSARCWGWSWPTARAAAAGATSSSG